MIRLLNVSRLYRIRFNGCVDLSKNLAKLALFSVLFAISAVFETDSLTHTLADELSLDISEMVAVEEAAEEAAKLGLLMIVAVDKFVVVGFFGVRLFKLKFELRKVGVLGVDCERN